MIRNLFGGSKCRTIDVCDIFGDNSGKALYRLDGNANDESGNYHGAETAITYGGGVYERGAVFAQTSGSRIQTTYTQPASSVASLSYWINSSTASNGYDLMLCDGDVTGASTLLRVFLSINVTPNWVIGTADGVTSWYDSTVSASGILNGSNHHIVITYSGTTIKLYVDNVLKNTYTSTVAFGAAGTNPLVIGNQGAYINTTRGFNGSIDQVRIFNRAITATEVATLYAECAPTSTVDNINPFEDGSLKALYQFNGDATDKTGVYNGTATNVTYSTGKFGQCAVFNGTTSKVVNTSVPSLGLYSTLSVWVYTTLTTTQSIAEYSNGTNLIAVYYDSTTIKIRVNALLYSVTKTIPKSVFNHIAVVLFNNVPSLYLDGTKFTLTSSAITAIAGTTGLRIGVANIATVDTYTNGSIDQVRILNKALTPMEVASLYNETTPLEEPMHSLVDPFKDGSGKALYRLEGNVLDESGNYNGTATNVTYGTGRFGRCFVGDGTVRKVAVPNMNFTSLNYSVSVWANFSSFTNYPTIFIHYTGMMCNIFYQPAGNVIAIGIFDGGWKYINFPSPILNTDYHIVLSVGGGFLNGYINNALIGTVAVGTLSNAAGGAYVGVYHDGSSYPMRGNIDQLRIFNRALTAGEVSQLYTEI